MPTDPGVLAHQQRLAEVQRESQRLRLAAFVDYAPVVCGFTLQPLTLRTFTLLQAWNNGFVCGGAVTLKDLVQFVWVHQPAFSQFAQAEARRVARVLAASLRPDCPVLNDVVHFVSTLPGWRWLARFRRPTAADLWTAAVDDVRRIVRESLHDFPSGGDDDKPLPYAQQAMFVSLFVRGYGVEFTRAEQLVLEMPLKRLMEYVREILHRLSNYKDSLLTPEEARVWVEYQNYKDAQIAARKAKAT